MSKIDVEAFLDQLSRETQFDDFFEDDIDLSCLGKSGKFTEDTDRKNVDSSYQERVRG